VLWGEKHFANFSMFLPQNVAGFFVDIFADEIKSSSYKMIDWCLVPTLTVFQLNRGVNKFVLTLKTLL
jgi:hypothetical protein